MVCKITRIQNLNCLLITQNSKLSKDKSLWEPRNSWQEWRRAGISCGAWMSYQQQLKPTGEKIINIHEIRDATSFCSRACTHQVVTIPVSFTSRLSDKYAGNNKNPVFFSKCHHSVKFYFSRLTKVTWYKQLHVYQIKLIMLS